MNPEDKQAKKLAKLLSAMDEGSMTTEDFLKHFDSVLTVVESIKATNLKEFDAIHGAIELLKKQLIDDNASDLSTIKQQVKDALAGQTAQITSKLQSIDAAVAALQDGEKGETGDIGPMGPAGPAGSPDMAEDIRNKLELLQGDERLDISAIKGLEEYDKRMKVLEERPNIGGWSTASGGKIMKYYDLTPLLDGSTKTFSLPAFWRVINIQCSSSPSTMRENVDYTVNGSLSQITFAASVDATTTLATGTTLIVLYAE